MDLHYRSCWTYERDVWDDQRSEQFVAETTRIVRELRRNPALAMFTVITPTLSATETQAFLSFAQNLVRNRSPWSTGTEILFGNSCNIILLHSFLCDCDFSLCPLMLCKKFKAQQSAGLQRGMGPA